MAARGVTPYLSEGGGQKKVPPTRAHRLALQVQTHSPDLIAMYLTKHKIPQIFENLSTLLVLMRPVQPLHWLSDLLTRVLRSKPEATGDLLINFFWGFTPGALRPKGKNGRAQTSVATRPGNFERYLEQNSIREIFGEAVSALVVAMPSDPIRAIHEMLEEEAQTREAPPELTETMPRPVRSESGNAETMVIWGGEEPPVVVPNTIEQIEAVAFTAREGAIPEEDEDAAADAVNEE